MPRHDRNTRRKNRTDRRRLAEVNAEVDEQRPPPFRHEEQFLSVPSVLTGRITWGPGAGESPGRGRGHHPLPVASISERFSAKGGA